MEESVINKGPIPGENYTSDTRNYPWHRPPDYTDLDSAIDHVISTLKKPRTSFAVMQMLKIGLTVSDVVGLMIMKGISMGKWSIDLGILLSGPLAHMVVIMAKAHDVKYDLGLNDEFGGAPTEAFFKASQKLALSEETEDDLDEVGDIAKATTQEEPTTLGFDSPPSPETEEEMV